MKPVRLFVPILAVITVACVLSAACGSSSSPTATVAATKTSSAGGTSASSTQAAAATAQPTSANTQAAGGSTGVTCDQLTNDDIQPLMTNPVIADDTSAVGTDSDGQQCIFHDADSEQAVDIIVVPESDQAVNYETEKAEATSPVAVSGIGDEAFREAGDDQPTATDGSLTCAISLGTSTQIPGVDALIVNGSLNLTDAQDTVIAAALGTVCNRIFGTGNTTPDLSGLATG